MGLTVPPRNLHSTSVLPTTVYGNARADVLRTAYVQSDSSVSDTDSQIRYNSRCSQPVTGSHQTGNHVNENQKYERLVCLSIHNKFSDCPEPIFSPSCYNITSFVYKNGKNNLSASQRRYYPVLVFSNVI